MVVILSSVTVDEITEVVDAWVGITCTFTGWDGSTWDLAKGTEGVVLQADGTEGMHDPVMTKYSSTSRAFAGKRSRGFRVESREVFWPILMFADSSDAFVDTYRRFFAAISPDKPGTWTVGYRGSERTLQVTGVYGQGYAFETHPTVLGSARFGVTLEAEQPFWTGDPVVRGPWANATSQDFYSADNTHLFYLSDSATIGDASMSNPGDADSYPLWTINGALTDVAVGVGDVVIDVPFDIADGSTLVIDTDPRNVTALLDGADVSETLGFQRFAPVPPGGEVSVHVEGTGAGSVSCELVPQYFRAT